VASITQVGRNQHLMLGRLHHGDEGAERLKSCVDEVMRAAKKAGHRGQTFKRSVGSTRRSTFGRGRRAGLLVGSRSSGRRVTVVARIVGHRGGRFRSAPLSKHIAYLKREGVTHDGTEVRMFNATSDDGDTKVFAQPARRTGTISSSRCRPRTRVDRRPWRLHSGTDGRRGERPRDQGSIGLPSITGTRARMACRNTSAPRNGP